MSPRFVPEAAGVSFFYPGNRVKKAALSGDADVETNTRVLRMRPVFAIIVISVAFWGCNPKGESHQVTGTGTTVMEARLQRLWFPVFYPAEELEDWLNRKFDREIAHALIPYRNDSVLLVVTRPGRIELSMAGDSVDVVFPLEIEVTEDRPGRSGKRIYRKFTGALNLYLNVVPDVNRNWEISTRTVLKGHEWTERPRLEAGGIKIGVKFIADYLLRNELRDLTRTLDDALREKVNLKKGLDRTWRNLQKPLPVFALGTDTLWFRIEPDSLWGDIKVERSGLVFNLAADVRARVHRDTTLYHPYMPLPDFRPLKQMQEDSNALEIMVTVPMEMINDGLQRVGKGYSYNRRPAFPEISDISLRGFGEKVALDLQTAGSAQAALTVIGTPQYDARTQTLVIRNPDYDLDTDHKILNALDKTFRDGFLKYIEKKVILDIGRYMDDLPGYLNGTINEGNHSDKFQLLFSEIEVKDIRHTIGESEVLIWLSCKPRFEITLKKLPVKKKVRIKGMG